MPPRSAKKAGTASGGKKTPGRASKGTPKAQNQPAAEETPKTQVQEEVKVSEPVVEEKKAEVVEAPSQPEPEPESKPEPNGSKAEKDEEAVQEVLEEEDKGERLDLDDNEVEYDHEEIGVDYDDKGTEDEELQEEEEGDGEEEPEEGDAEEGEEEDDDMEDVGEEELGEEEQGEEEQTEEGHEELAEREQEELAEREDEEHHDVVKERRKRKEFEVFVGGLDKDASEDDLRKVFSVVGEIVEVRLMMHPQTKKNKGFAFLRFATVEQAKRAVKELKNPVVNGKQCGVTPSQDSDTLFLGNICKSWTKEALKEKLKQYGIDSVEDLTLVEDSNNEGMNRGFAFLEFSSRSDAMDAYKRLQKRDVVFGVDRNAKVAFADSFIEPDDEIMAQVKTVFVDGLPASWDEDRVKEHLKKYGEIEKVELARNMPSAKRKDFGFVTFDTHDNAVICAESINNAELGDGDNKVKVRARLSRPLQRGKGKPSGRGDFRSGRGAPRGGRLSWARPAPRSFPSRGIRAAGGRLAPIRGRGFKGPVGYRDRRPTMAIPERARPLPPPPRSYSRKPAPAYPRSSSKRDFVRREELPPRNRVAVDYSSRAAPERRSSYKVDYAPRGSGYSDDVPRVSARPAPRRVAYVDEVYERRFERLPPSYREERPRDYDSISGSKRPYSAVEDVSPRYVDAGVRPSRTRLDYGVGGSSSQYADTYGDRVGRSQLGYAGSRSSLSAQESQGVYGSRPGMSYAGGSYGTSDGGSYSSSYGRDYPSRGTDMGDKPYSSLYSSRDLGGSSYLGGGGSRSYY